VLDACFSGAAVFQLNKTGRMVMTASNYTRSSLEDTANQHGLFTNYFLKSFERSGTTAAYSGSVDVNLDGILTWNEVWNYVSPQTIARSAALNYVHEPAYKNNLTDTNTVFRPTIIKNESSNFNNGIFSLNFTVYGSNHINDITYQWTFSNSTIETHSITSPLGLDFGTYEAKFIPTGVDDVSAYLVSVTFANGMVLNLGDAAGSTDSDGDGIENMVETMMETTTSLTDTDTDGLNDYKELIVYGTNATAKDTDSDGLEDDEELLVALTSPFDSDCDNDGLNDFQEEITYLTNPYETDSDLDGYSDFEEIQQNTDPLDPNNNPGTVRMMYITIGIVIVSAIALLIIFSKLNKSAKQKRVARYQNRPPSFNQDSYSSSNQQNTFTNENVGYCINCGAKLVREGPNKVCPYCGSRY
jgi:rubrerythrin